MSTVYRIKTEKNKVCFSPGSTTKDMLDYIKPLLKKSPDNVILHIGTNDAVNNPLKTVLENILSLKQFIETLLTNTRACVYNLIIKTGDRKVTLTTNKTNQHLSALWFNIIDNSNIGVNCLNGNGLYLNGTGMGKLSINLINKIKSLNRSLRGMGSLRDKFCNFCRNDEVLACVKQGIENINNPVCI